LVWAQAQAQAQALSGRQVPARFARANQWPTRGWFAALRADDPPRTGAQVARQIASIGIQGNGYGNRRCRRREIIREKYWPNASIGHQTDSAQDGQEEKKFDESPYHKKIAPILPVARSECRLS